MLQKLDLICATIRSSCSILPMAAEAKSSDVAAAPAGAKEPNEGRLVTLLIEGDESTALEAAYTRRKGCGKQWLDRLAAAQFHANHLEEYTISPPAEIRGARAWRFPYKKRGSERKRQSKADLVLHPPAV